MLDLPGPARLHGFRDGVRQDRLVTTLPATHQGPIAEQGVGVADERRAQGLADQFGAEAGSVHEEVRRQAAAILQLQSLHLAGRLFDRLHVAVDDLDAEFRGQGLEPRDELRVFDMVADGLLHQRPRTFRASREDLVLRHERSRRIGVRDGLVAHETDGHVGLAEAQAQGAGEAIVVILLSPQELDAELQRRLHRPVKLRGRDAQMSVDEIKEVGSAALAHADDAEAGTTHQPDAQGRVMRLQAGGHEETCGAATKDEDILNHKGERLG